MQNDHGKHPPLVSLKDGIFQVLGNATPYQQAMDSRPADFSTGISSLDEKLQGLYRGDLLFIRECSFECSTCLDVVLARNVAVKGHGTVLYVSKYHATDLAARLMTAECGIPYDTMVEGRLTDEQWQQIGFASAALSTLPIFADETMDFSPEYLRRRCAEIPDLDMLVVSRFLDDPLPSGDTIMQLKQLAQELNIVVLLSVQYYGMARNVWLPGTDVHLLVEYYPENRHTLEEHSITILKNAHGPLGQLSFRSIPEGAL